MIPVAADCNLLLALLVRRLALVDLADLAMALGACASDPVSSLGAVLLKRGLLDADSLALLESLAQRYRERHGTDLAGALRALDPTGEDRQMFSSLIAGETLMPSSSPLASPTVSPNEAEETGETIVRPSLQPAVTTTGPTPPSASSPRFLRLRPHAHGGLGEVYLAHDMELHREVAVKEIRLCFADDPQNRARFLLEGEVTGRLEHPGIVPIYGMGTHGDGRPYYAMRFIHGETLLEAIRRFHGSPLPMDGPRLLQRRDLLGRFVAVCNAVAYAHSRGVLHRDLKPANIMLGPFGETLVVDWGLARVRGEAEPGAGAGPADWCPLVLSPAIGSAPTMGQTAIGTPAYMSPEQAAGELETLGPATDVYSLGATLYELLTGQAPFHARDLDAEFDAVRRGKFPPPRQVHRETPPALEAICLKAMQLEPARRYASPSELAQDVERWLADEPVSVYREPLLARLGRWARRHRTLVTGAAALLLTALVCLSVSSVLIWQEQDRTRRAHQRADDNFRTARKAVDDLLTEVAEEQLVHEPHMEQKRRNLLRRARSYYTAFLKQGANDPDLREEAARAHLRLGDIARQLDELAGARVEYEHAIALLDELTAGPHSTAGLRLALADAHNFLGEVHRLGHDGADPVTEYRLALEVLDRMGGDEPGVRERKARCQYNLGIVFTSKLEHRKAVAAFDRAIALLRGQATDARRRPHYHQDLARAYLNRGPAVVGLGRGGAAEAKKDFEHAIGLLGALEREHPRVPGYRHELGVARMNLGELSRQRGQLGQAVLELRRARQLFEVLVEKHPAVPVYRADLATACNNLGGALMQQSEIGTRSAVALLLGPPALPSRLLGLAAWPAARSAQSEAWQQWQTAGRLLDRVIGMSDVPHYRALRGLVNGNLGRRHLREGRPRQARQALAVAVDDLTRAAAAKRDTSNYTRYRDLFRRLLERAARAERPGGN